MNCLNRDLCGYSIEATLPFVCGGATHAELSLLSIFLVPTRFGTLISDELDENCLVMTIVSLC